MWTKNKPKNMKATMSMIKSVATVAINGQIKTSIKGISLMIWETVMAKCNGQMEGIT